VGKHGEVLGVNIVPGIKTAIKSLFSNTSKLPEVALKVPGVCDPEKIRFMPFRLEYFMATGSLIRNDQDDWYRAQLDLG